MAVTTNRAPQIHNTAYNPVVFSVSSNNYTQSNFKFIVDIYLNGAVTPLPRMKFPPLPSANYQAIDVGGIIKNYITRDPFVIGDTLFKTNDNSLLQVQVNFGEEYGPSSGITSYPNLASSGVTYSFNAALSYEDFVAYNQVDYSTSGTSKKFLSNAPRVGGYLNTNNISTTESYWLYFLNPANSQHYYISVVAYDASNNVLAISTTTANPYAVPVTVARKHLRIGVGPYDLSLLTNVDLTGGSTPILPASTAYYWVWLSDSGGARNSEIARFYVTSKCSKASTNYRLVWLNSLGGYDAFTFYGQNQRTSEIERKVYKKYAGYFSGNTFIFDNQNSRQNSQFNTIVKDTYKITSDWINEAESNWLEELFTSPDVYYVSGTELIPINITDGGYVFKSVSRDQLFNIELSFKPSYERMRQQW